MNASLDAVRLRALVGERGFVTRLEVLEACASTNDEVRRLAAEGAGEGTVVVAAEQTAGRGRMGRAWDSPPGCGLYLSVLLRPRDGVEHVTRWTLGAAVAACDACRALSGAPVRIKWPNDLLVDRGKVAGILAELRAPAQRAELAIGLGVNVLQGARDFPAELRGRATSLNLGARPGRLAAGHAREALAALYLEHLGPIVARLHAGDWPAVAAAWLDRAPGADGCTVRVVQRRESATETWLGTTRGIEPDGALRVERAGGGVETVRIADSIDEL